MSTASNHSDTSTAKVTIAAYTDERAANRALDSFTQRASEQLLSNGNAVVLRCDSNGKVHIFETADSSETEGVGLGALFGGIVGLLGGPAGIAVGIGAGAAIGATVTHKDLGFDNDTLSTLGAALPAATSALVATADFSALDAAAAGISKDLRLANASQLAGVITKSLAAGNNMLLTISVENDAITVSHPPARSAETELFGIWNDGYGPIG